MTNEELVERFSRVEFSYFRQISFVLATVTLFFGFLLIAVLLTVSVNQRLGEIAALRALGLSRRRVVAGVLCESVMMVGAGAILAIPIGAALSVWLDAILRALPGIPTDVHFFVFEARALLVYGWLLAAASVGAALYPMRIVARAADRGHAAARGGRVTTPIVEARHVSREFPMAAAPVTALSDVSLRIAPGGVRGGRRPFGLRQIDVAAHPRLR